MQLKTEDKLDKSETINIAVRYSYHIRIYEAGGESIGDPFYAVSC